MDELARLLAEDNQDDTICELSDIKVSTVGLVRRGAIGDPDTDPHLLWILKSADNYDEVSKMEHFTNNEKVMELLREAYESGRNDERQAPIAKAAKMSNDDLLVSIAKSDANSREELNAMADILCERIGPDEFSKQLRAQIKRQSEISAWRGARE